MIKRGEKMIKKKFKLDYTSQEQELKKRLEELENEYKKNLFPAHLNENLVENTPKITESKKEIKSKPEEKIEPSKFDEFSESDKPSKLETFEEKSEVSRQVSPIKITNVITSQIKEIKLKGTPRPTEKEVKNISENIIKMKKEMSKVLVGQEEIADGLIRALICNGHVLLEGIPGIAKTLAIRALGAVSGCDTKRIQFTVDLLPTDIMGITSYTPEKGFEVIKGPIFANFLIADEINRSPPKTQSALIEGMQEKQVTIGKETFKLPVPFFVMATENPLENAGVYPLPEAQIDRFLFKLIMGYPQENEEREIMVSNITLQKFEDFNLKPVITPRDILYMQEVVKKVYLDENIKSYILEIVKRTRNKKFQDSEYLSYGASPRASIALFIASKSKALMEGRNYVIPEDVKAVAFDILRHRLILSYKATLKNINPDDLIKNILNEIRV
jgi:MoxR-like ATPase